MNKIKLATKSIFKTFLLSLTIISQVHFAYAQSSASILPPAKTTFFDSNGNPLSSGKVFSYIPGTTTPKTTWQDAAETIPNANPVILDAAGRALVLGSGNYRQQVYDRNNNLQWDQVTSSTGSGGGTGPIATGDGDLVGTVKPWAGMIAPNQYAFAYGQELSRTLFPALFAAITSTQAVFCNSGSPVLNGLGDTTNFWVGMSVELSCLGGGTSTIIAKTSNSLTMASNSNVTQNTSATFFPWGRGNGTTTFNLPDYRGYVLAGNDNMGGTASGVLTTANFGATNPNSTGAAGGSQIDSITLAAGNIPSLTSVGNNNIVVFPLGTNTGLLYAYTSGNFTDVTTTLGGGAIHVPTSNLAWNGTNGISGSNNITVTTNGTNNSPFTVNRIQPTKTVNYIIKTTPDSNAATASGVTSLGTMTGDIACGSGLTCTGNVISNAQVFNTPNTQDFLATIDFTGGTTTTLTLPSIPTSSANLTITFDGISQNSNTWLLAGAVITFNAAIPLNTQVVETKWFTSSSAAGVSFVNSLNGVVNINAGNGTTVATLGQTITVSNSINSASVHLNNINEQWIPPNPNRYHLFIANAVKFNQNGFFQSCCGTVGAAWVPPTGSSLVELHAQIWATSGVTASGNMVAKWIKNASIDVNGNQSVGVGVDVCTGIGNISDFGSGTAIMRADCVDQPSPGDYYNLFMFIDSTSLGVTTVVVDGNPAHTFVQATVLK
jgi:hypothetical protein